MYVLCMRTTGGGAEQDGGTAACRSHRRHVRERSTFSLAASKRAWHTLPAHPPTHPPTDTHPLLPPSLPLTNQRTASPRQAARGGGWGGWGGWWWSWWFPNQFPRPRKGFFRLAGVPGRGNKPAICPAALPAKYRSLRCHGPSLCPWFSHWGQFWDDLFSTYGRGQRGHLKNGVISFK